MTEQRENAPPRVTRAAGAVAFPERAEEPSITDDNDY
jgi:hypothetical protein